MFLSREITSEPLNPSVIGKLLRAGLHTASCFSSLNSSILNLCTGIQPEEAEQVLKILHHGSQESEKCSIKSALELFTEKQEEEHIVTFCESVDTLLVGGVPLGKVVEFCGAPGTGKTQFCFQLAVDAHIPECFGGVEGETVYIDTEGSLVIDRLSEIAKAAVAHCHQVTVSPGTNKPSQIDLSVEKILKGIHIYHCHDYHELMATIQILPEILSQNKKVKLVIVDSLASPFRHNLEDMNLRRLLLATLAKNFLKMASDFKVAVVLTNQMTTKIMAREGDSHQIPALGDTWAHVPASRLLLSADCYGNRVASLLKASDWTERSCSFQITDDGVRDVFHSSTQERQRQPP